VVAKGGQSTPHTNSGRVPCIGRRGKEGGVGAGKEKNTLARGRSLEKEIQPSEDLEARIGRGARRAKHKRKRAEIFRAVFAALKFEKRLYRDEGGGVGRNKREKRGGWGGKLLR